MGTCRFLRWNLLESATVLNGTAGSPTPPARSESSPFVMERVLNSERRSLWRSGATNSTAAVGMWQLDLDAGSAIALDALHVGGLSCPGGEIQSVTFGYLNSYPSATYMTIDTVSLSGTPERDCGVTFNSLTKRYWFILIEATAAPTVGLVKGGALYDLGLAPNPGSTSSPFRNRSETVLQDGSVHMVELGYPGREFSLNFDPVTAAQRDSILELGTHAGSLVYVDPDGKFFEVFIRGGQIQVTRYYSDLYGVSVPMGRLP